MLNILSIPQPFVAKTGLNLLIYVVTVSKESTLFLKLVQKNHRLALDIFLCVYANILKLYFH